MAEPDVRFFTERKWDNEVQKQIDKVGKVLGWVDD